ncbi:MAG: murein biosynthesis integral membrane protein MurJ [Anaerolineales bacterium]|nr:murein biosynthesis integral membrane protein MurJ [Anaerolineales bacterium]
MKHIARSSLIIAVFFGLEKVLGFLRQVLVARSFKLSPELDAFNAANNIPDLLFALISGGALAMAFIPVLTEYREAKGQKETWSLFSQITNLVFLTTAGLSLLVALSARKLVTWNIGIAPGFDPEMQTLVTSLMRLNLIATILFSLGGLAIAGLQSHQHFLLPALAPSLYDIGSLLGILILAPEKGYTLGPITLPALGMGVYGLVYGVVLGAALFLIIQVPGLMKFRFQWTPKLNWHHPGVQKVIHLMAPRILTVFFIQLIFISQDNLASRLATGSVTALVYGWLFMQVPETLIGTSLGTALLPTLAEQITRGDKDKFQATLGKIIRVILSLTIPGAVFLTLGLAPVIRILDFDSAGQNLVLWTARAFLAGLIGHSLLEVAARTFYAQKNARIPLFASGITLVVFLGLGVVLAPRLGAPGIGLANSTAFSLEAVILFGIHYRRFPRIPGLSRTLFRAFIGTILGAAVILFSQHLFPPSSFPSLTGLFLSALYLTAAAAVTIPFIWPEIMELLQLES